MTLPPQIMRRLTRELTKLSNKPPSDYRLQLNEEDILAVKVWIQGPADTPYVGGFFLLTIDFLSGDYPSSPPHCLLKTKIFHPNVSTKGDICVSTLKEGWTAETGVDFLVRTIIGLLVQPNPDSVLDQPEAGRLMHDSYDEFQATARIWTRIHAMERPECWQLEGDLETAAAAAAAVEQGVASSSAASGSSACVDDKEQGEGLSKTGATLNSQLMLPLGQSGTLNRSPSQLRSTRGAAQQSASQGSASEAMRLNDKSGSVASSTKRKSDELNLQHAETVKRRAFVPKRGLKRL